MTAEERIDGLSVHYYNLGLECARVKNLSGAIEHLRRCLEIDKRNTDARNLLGLCYYACGEIVEALGAWVVSKHFSPEDNVAEQYLDDVQGDPVMFDTMSQAVNKYNRGLEFARDGKMDLAMIQLKKAVSTYPNFIRAMQLLALLFMMNNEADRAVKLVNRILSIDCANSTALYYLKELENANASGRAINSGARDTVEESFVATKLEDEVTETELLDDGPNVMAFIGLIAGILIGVAVVFFLIVPSRDAAIRDEYRQSEKDYSESLNIKLARINALEIEIAKLNMENTELSASLTEAKATIEGLVTETPEFAAMFSDLFTATEAYLEHMIDRKVCESKNWAYDTNLLFKTADALAKVDIETTSDENAIKLYNTMCNNVMNDAAQRKYNEGYAKYQAGSYLVAIDELTKATLYKKDYDQALYYLARSYENNGNTQEAITKFELLINRCPNSRYVAYAVERLNNLKGE